MNSAVFAHRVSLRLLVAAVVFFAMGCTSSDSANVEMAAPTSAQASASTSTATTTPVVATPAGTRPVGSFRVLAEDVRAGEPGTTAIVATADDFAPVAAESGVDVGSVDFSVEVVFVFDFAESSSPICAITPMEDLVYDEDLGRLHPVTSDGRGKNTEIECLGDANQHRVLVAVARSALPAEAFEIWLSADEPPECCPDRAAKVGAGELSS